MNRTKWTKEKDDFLKEFYPTMGGNYCIEKLGISRPALEHRISILAIVVQPKWTEDQDRVIKDFYIKEGCKFCMKILGRTESAIQHRAKTIKIARPNKAHTVWNKEKELLLIDNYYEKGPDFCNKLLGLSLRQIYSKASCLKLKRPTPKEGHQFCGICKKEKPISEYEKTSRFARGTSYNCKNCKKEIRDKNKIINPFRPWARSTIRQHKERGYNIDFSIEGLVSKARKIKNCPFCKQHISWFNKKTQENSPTLDRLENNQDLTLQNIEVICWRCNTSKSKKTIKEFRDYLKLASPEVELYYEEYSSKENKEIDYQI